MKVSWEGSDLYAGRKVWRDMECLIGRNPENWKDPVVLIVSKTGRVMKIGSEDEVAEYMTKFEYRPTKEQ